MNKVFEYLRANEARFVEELSTYLRFSSVSTQSDRRADLLNCVEWLVAHCRSIGLDARAISTSGNPVVLASTRRRVGRRHFVLYGHYDVQPPEPFAAWQSAPFEPTIRDGFVYARGASDNKGPHFAHLKALEAFLKTDTELPCDVTVMIEGEEEVGSHSLPAFTSAYRTELACDALIISDTTLPSLKMPGVTCSLRGLVSAEVRATGPNRDLHSGIYGGAAENPALALCHILAQCRDANGAVTIPHFADDIRALTTEEAADLSRIEIDESAYCRSLGVDSLIGSRKISIPTRTTALPTFEVNGFVSGYTGEGVKTIIPSQAVAKVSMRLVADQKPIEVYRAFEAHLNEPCPPGITLSISPGFLAQPYAIEPTNRFLHAALDALRVAFDYEPLRLREGASIPIVAVAKRELGVDSILVGLALPEDRPHAPNERFSLESFRCGQRMSALLWNRFAQT